MIDAFGAELDRLGRLVNIRWGFTSPWVPLSMSIEQFAAHSLALQSGLALECQDADGSLVRLMPDEVCALFRSASRAAHVDLDSLRDQLFASTVL